MDALNVLPLLGHPLLHERVCDGVDVLGNLVRSPVGKADADGDVGGGGKADEGGANGLGDLLGNPLGAGGVDFAFGLGALALAINLGGLGLEDDGDGALLGGLVESLAEDLGQSVDNAVVGKEDVVLGVQLALGFVLRKLGLELGDINDTANLATEVGRKLVSVDNVLVGALRVGGNEADG